MKHGFSLLNFIKVVLLLAFMLLCAMSYHPYVYSVSSELANSGEAIVSPFITYIMLILLLLILLSCIKAEIPIINKVLLKYVYIVVLVLIFSLLIYGISPQKSVTGDLKAIFTCMGAFFVGWRLILDEKIVKRLLFYYGALVCFVGLLQIIVNIGGFVILATYETNGKNALGAMLAVSTVLFVGIANSSSGSRFERIVALVMGGLSLVELLTIRARLATISAIVVAFLVYYFSHKNKKKRSSSYILILMVLVITVLILPNYVYDYVYYSFLLNKEDDITAGRTAINLNALLIVIEDPLVANLYNTHWNIKVHNWLLKRLYEYGMLLSIPLLVLYIKMFLSLCKKLFKPYSDSFQVIGYAMVLALFVISFGEPSMPFSPGTAMTTAYFFWGYSYQRLSYNKNCNIYVNS